MDSSKIIKNPCFPTLKDLGAVFSGYTLLFPRNLRTSVVNVSNDFAMDTKSQSRGWNAKPYINCIQINAQFVFVSGIICWGHILLQCATRSDDA